MANGKLKVKVEESREARIKIKILDEVLCAPWFSGCGELLTTKGTKVFSRGTKELREFQEVVRKVKAKVKRKKKKGFF